MLDAPADEPKATASDRKAEEPVRDDDVSAARAKEAKPAEERSERTKAARTEPAKDESGGDDAEDKETKDIEVTVGPGAVMALLAPATGPAAGTAKTGDAAAPLGGQAAAQGTAAPALSDEVLEAMRRAGAELSGEAAKGEKSEAKQAAAAKAAAELAAAQTKSAVDGGKALNQLSEMAGETPVAIRAVAGTAAQPAPDAATTAAQAQATVAALQTPQAQRTTDKTGSLAATAAVAEKGAAPTAGAQIADAAAAMASDGAEGDTAEGGTSRAATDAAAKPLPQAAGTIGGTGTGMTPDAGAQGAATTAAQAALGEAGAKPQAPTAFTQHLATTARPDVGAFAAAMSREAATGKKTFEIQLDPPELGRVEVRLEFHRDGRMNTHLIVDRLDTLDMLSRDARALERSLAQQGFNLDGEGLSFELRDGNGFAGNSGEHDGSESGSRHGGGPEDDAVPEIAATQTRPGGRMTGSSGLDIRI